MNKVTWMHADGTVEEEYTDSDIAKGDTKAWDETVSKSAQAVKVEVVPEPEPDAQEQIAAQTGDASDEVAPPE